MPSLANMRTKAKEAGLMKLDRLIAKRQHIPTNEFPVPLKELCERYEKLYTGCVNDVMRELTLLDQNLPHDIMPLRDEMTVCGEAFTVKSAPNVRRGVHREERPERADRGRDDVPRADAGRLQAGRRGGVGHLRGRGGQPLGRRDDRHRHHEGHSRRGDRRRHPRHEADPGAELPRVLQVPRVQRLPRTLHDHALPGARAHRQGDGCPCASAR